MEKNSVVERTDFENKEDSQIFFLAILFPEMLPFERCFQFTHALNEECHRKLVA